MLKYLKDREDLKVKRTVGNAGRRWFFSIMRNAKQARIERGRKLFEIFRQGGNELYISSLARWDTHLKGLAELEWRCQDLMQEVKLLSERQEVLVGMVVIEKDMQKEAPKKYQEKMFKEFKE